MLDIPYKSEPEYQATKRCIDDKNLNQKLVQDFKFHYSNIRSTYEADCESDQFVSVLYSFIRNMKLFLNGDGKDLPCCFIEEEMIIYLLNILNLKDASTDLLIETLDLLNHFVKIINVDDPLSIFEGNEQYTIDTLEGLASKDYEDINIQILIFMTSIYSGTEDSASFIFSILSFDDLRNLLESNFLIYGKRVSNLILKFMKYPIPSDQIENIFYLIKSILENGEKNSFLSCIDSLGIIVNYCREEDKTEDEKEFIENILENDTDLPKYCINNLKLDDYRIPCSIFSFICKMCVCKFNLQNYYDLFKKADEVLDLYSNLNFHNSIEIRGYASRVFFCAFYYDFSNNRDFLLQNALQYINSLEKIITDDSYTSSFYASQAFLAILVHLADNELSKIFPSEKFFYIMKRILEFDKMNISLFINAVNFVFHFAEINNYTQLCLEEFCNRGFDELLEDIKENTENSNDYQIIEQFLKDFDEKRSQYLQDENEPFNETN